MSICVGSFTDLTSMLSLIEKENRNVNDKPCTAVTRVLFGGCSVNCPSRIGDSNGHKKLYQILL